MERYSKFSLFGRFIPRDLWAALPIQPVVWFLLKGNHNGVQWGLRRGASRFISGGGSSFLNPVPPVHQKYRTTLKNWRGFFFFLVKDDPCGTYRSDKGMGVWSLWPFYSPLSAVNRFVLLSLTSAFGPMGSSAQIFADKAWWDWAIMPAPAPLENTELLESCLCKYTLFPQKRTVVLMTNWVKSHLAWSK